MARELIKLLIHACMGYKLNRFSECSCWASWYGSQLGAAVYTAADCQVITPSFTTAVHVMQSAWQRETIIIVHTLVVRLHSMTVQAYIRSHIATVHCSRRYVIQ